MPSISPPRVRAIVVDWAGTIVDHGSRAPVEAFREIFRRRGVEITAAEARGPMGMEKRDHIAALLAVPRIAQAWQSAHGLPATATDIQQLYDSFLPVQMDILPDHADVIAGARDVFDWCRARDIRVGSSSGYARPLMDRLVALAAATGLTVDAVVSASEVAGGRPAPWMIFRNLEQLAVCQPPTAVVVDDTTVGIEAGRNAGTWTVGVVESGNLFGIAADELTSLAAADRAARLASGQQAMFAAGAHYTLASIAELPQTIAAIDARLAHGERP